MRSILCYYTYTVNLFFYYQKFTVHVSYYCMFGIMEVQVFLTNNIAPKPNSSALLIRNSWTQSYLHINPKAKLPRILLKILHWAFYGNYLIYWCLQPSRGGYRGVSEVSRNHSGFSFDDGWAPFQLQRFTRHTQWAE